MLTPETFPVAYVDAVNIPLHGVAPMPIPPRFRPDALPTAALLLAGTVALVAGGRRHPEVGTSLGAVGTPAYFEAFADAVLASHGWQPMHALILAGPVLWALGVAGIRLRAEGIGSSLAGIARAALTIGAAVWALAFVFDGFIAPRLARALVAATGEALRASSLAAFGVNQAMVAHLGGVGLALIGTGSAALATALLADAPLRWGRGVFALVGVALGAWPLVAILTGEFSPGPFASALWRPTALAMGAWYIGLAILVLRDAFGGRDTAATYRPTAR